MIYTNFQDCLENIFGVNAVPAEIGMSGADCGPSFVASMLLAVANQGERLRNPVGILRKLDEDFILGPLSAGMTLYKPMDIIEVARKFYGQMGLKQTDLSVMCKGAEEILHLEGEGLGGMVQFDLGRGYRNDDKLELWVTTMFGTRERK